MDIPTRTITLHVNQNELDRRKTTWTVPDNPRLHGVLGKYAKLVHSAAEGAVLY